MKEVLSLLLWPNVTSVLETGKPKNVEEANAAFLSRRGLEPN